MNITSHLPLAVFLFLLAFLGCGESTPLEKLWSCKLYCKLIFITPFRLSIKHQKQCLHKNDQVNYIADTRVTEQELMTSCSLGETTTFVGLFDSSLLQGRPSSPSIRQTPADSVAQVLKGGMSRINSYLSITSAKMHHARGWVEAVIATANKNVKRRYITMT